MSCTRHLRPYFSLIRKTPVTARLHMGAWEWAEKTRRLLCSSKFSVLWASSQSNRPQLTFSWHDLVFMDVPWGPLFLLQTKVGFWHQPPQQWNGNISQLRILNPYVTYEATYKLLQLNASSRVWYRAGEQTDDHQCSVSSLIPYCFSTTQVEGKPSH